MMRTNGAAGFMNKVVWLALMLTFAFGSTGCVKSIQAVSSLEELSTKEDLAKTHSWYKQSAARGNAGFVMGATLVLFPVAMVMANIPNYTNLTVAQISEFSATAAYDYNAIFYREWVAYTSGAWAPDYWIIGRGMGMKDDQGRKPVGVIFDNKKDNKAYYEVWVIRKDETNKQYLAWRAPVLKKKGDKLVYALDENLVLEKTKMVGGYNLMNFTFLNAADGAEVVKKENDILIDFKNSYMQGGTMAPLQYCDENRDEKEQGKLAAPDKSSTSTAPNAGIAN